MTGESLPFSGSPATVRYERQKSSSRCPLVYRNLHSCRIVHLHTGAIRGQTPLVGSLNCEDHRECGRARCDRCVHLCRRPSRNPAARKGRIRMKNSLMFPVNGHKHGGCNARKPSGIGVSAIFARPGFFVPLIKSLMPGNWGRNVFGARAGRFGPVGATVGCPIPAAV